MAKLIKLTDDVIEAVKQEFDAYIKDKISDGRISFQKTVNTVQRKAIVYFTELAYRKFQALVKEFDKEVAWHGVAYRGKDASKDEYFITDILVYPQEVTGATVTTDQNKYQTWLMNHEDDVFNNIRMQGHSHVNFQTFASGTDLEHQRKIIDQLEDGMFYIFMIWNKRLERNVMIYDYANNVYYENSDVDIPGMEFSFLTDARKHVETVYSKSQWSGGSGGATSVGSPYNPVKSTTPATTTSATAPAATATPKTEEKKTAATTEKKIEVVSANAPVKTEAPKTEEPKSKPKATVRGAGWRGRVAAYDDEDDDDSCFGTLLHRIATM